MRREAPLIIMAVSCIIQLVEYFFTNPTLKAVGSELRTWGSIISAFALGIGVIGTIMIHYNRVRTREAGFWPHSLWFLALFGFMCVIGWGVGTDAAIYQWLFSNILSNLWATMLGTTGFFIIYAAYRAFRARNLEAVIMLTAGILTIFKNVLVLRSYWEGFYSIGNWIFRIPTAAAMRGMTIGASIGLAVLSLRAILGYERAFLGMPTEEEGTAAT
jgi:hypothetical protein